MNTQTARKCPYCLIVIVLVLLLRFQVDDLSGRGDSRFQMRSIMSFATKSAGQTLEEMELESHSELDSKSSRGSTETELKPADLKTDRFVWRAQE